MDLPHFDAAALAAGLAFRPLVAHLRSAFAARITTPVRLSVQRDERCEMLVMPALSSHYAGVKTLLIIPDNSAHGLPTIQGLFALLDATNGAPLATMDAGELTARRTAAVSALASEQLSRPDSANLLIAGTGHLAPYLAEAHASVRSIRTVRIWGREPEKAAVCCRKIAQRLPEILVEVAHDLRIAVQESDIVSTATRANNPIIRGEWGLDGKHVDLVGGYKPDMREIDDSGIRGARIFVDTIDGALAEAGDLVSPMARGIITMASIIGDISSLSKGARRISPDEITVFKSVGSAASDLGAAEHFWLSRPT
jgi:ornithine cyclodeaminase/alanine dehydrogenase-like protein (mu-crystallin family)